MLNVGIEAVASLTMQFYNTSPCIQASPSKTPLVNAVMMAWIRTGRDLNDYKLRLIIPHLNTTSQARATNLHLQYVQIPVVNGRLPFGPEDRLSQCCGAYCHAFCADDGCGLAQTLGGPQG